MTVALTSLRRRLFRAPVVLYHWGFSRLLGHRFVLLIHVGRRTGRRRETVLEVMEFGPQGPEIVVMSGFGRHPDWLRNIEAAPHPQVAIGTQRFAASWRRLGIDEAVQVIADYERRNRLALPIVHPVLSRLLGWRYDGSAAARRRAAEQLPVIGFRPRS